jgi:ABC-2 type transport system permease protein
MRLWNIFTKCIREQKRDLWILLLSVAFAPLFVFLYWLLTSAGGSTTYGLLVINQDRGSGGLQAGKALISQLESFTYENGSPFLRVMEVNDRAEAETRLRNRDAAALMIIPADFSSVVVSMQKGGTANSTQLQFVGDMTYPTYTVAAVSAMTVADHYLTQLSGETHPIRMVEHPLGASSARSEFENYIPGLLIFAVILMIFQSSMMVARECEGGKIIRMRLAGITSFEFLGGISLWLVVISVFSVGLTFLTALLLGFKSQGSLWLAIGVVVLTSLSVIGVGLIVGSLAKSVSQAFVIANFPLGFLMFLTGAIIPLPRTNLFTWFGHGFAIYDILPPTHAVIALNKIFTLGAAPADVLYELVMLSILTIVYFSAGVGLFKRVNLYG